VVRSPLNYAVILRGQSGDVLLWSGSIGYSPERWKDGELVTDPLRWQVPRDQASGDYAVVLLVDNQAISLGQVTIAGVARAFELPTGLTAVGATFGGALRLSGYSSTISNGVLDLKLVWNSLQAVDQDYTVFVHVLDSTGAIVAQRDQTPQGGQYPTSLWLPGEYVTDPYRFELPPGQYSLEVGLYSQTTGARLSAENGTKVLEDNRVPLANFRVS
jgi:hypothetical protein